MDERKKIDLARLSRLYGHLKGFKDLVYDQPDRVVLTPTVFNDYNSVVEKIADITSDEDVKLFLLPGDFLQEYMPSGLGIRGDDFNSKLLPLLSFLNGYLAPQDKKKSSSRKYKDKTQIEFRGASQTYRAKTSDIVGEGGSARVYRAVDQNGKVVAVKLLKTTDEEKTRRFVAELRFCYANRNPSIIQVLDHGRWKNRLFYVAPIFNKTFRDVMNEGANKEELLKYFEQIIEGMIIAHNAGVVHRDLKPENLLFDLQQDRAVIADFGIARMHEAALKSAVTKKGARLANFPYAAPEQREKKGIVDHRTDIYSLGLILNEIFTGSLAVGADHPKIAEVDSNYATLDTIVEWMTQYKKEARPESLDEVKQRLAELGFRMLESSTPAGSTKNQAPMNVLRGGDPFVLVETGSFSGNKTDITLKNRGTNPAVNIRLYGNDFHMLDVTSLNPLPDVYKRNNVSLPTIPQGMPLVYRVQYSDLSGNQYEVVVSAGEGEWWWVSKNVKEIIKNGRKQKFD